MQKWTPLIEDEPSKIDVLVTVVDENFYYNVELGEVLKAEYTTKKVSPIQRWLTFFFNSYYMRLGVSLASLQVPKVSLHIFPITNGYPGKSGSFFNLYLLKLIELLNQVVPLLFPSIMNFTPYRYRFSCSAS